jgi:nucleotide-binding universal stress UspA family protein
MLTVRSILVPIDFSEHARLALEHSRAFAEAFDAHLDLLHVIEEPSFPSFYKTGAVALYGEVPDLQEAARTALRDLFGEVEPNTLHQGIGFHVRQDVVADAITDFAASHDTDLIVIASHGLTGLKHHLLGSNAEKVMRLAPCPVLVVKAFGKSLIDASDDG